MTNANATRVIAYTDANQPFIADSDNGYALLQWLETGHVESLRAHVAHPDFRADDDAGWELRRISSDPSVRACCCGSGYHWASCPGLPELGNSYCG